MTQMAEMIRVRVGNSGSVPLVDLVDLWKSHMEEARGEGQGVGGDVQRDGGADTCTCPKCGATAQHERGTPCGETPCPECGTMMMGTPAASSDEPEEDADENPEVSETFAEAGTLKARAQALLKNLTDILREKALPDDLRKEIEGVRTTLRHNWSSLSEKVAPGAMDALGTAATLAETVTGEVDVLEEGVVQSDQNPLVLSVKLIEPGMGNKKHKHYYSRQVLKRDAHVFVGAKMYETDHKQRDKSTRTWVSTIRGIRGYTPTGAPIAEVVVHSPDFANRLRNLKKAGMLDKMEASILAEGKVRRGTVNGDPANIVEAIVNSSSVDWVTRAGAGGHAMDIVSESEQAKEGVMTQKTSTDEDVVVYEDAQEGASPGLTTLRAATMLTEARLPKVAMERLAEGEYLSEEALSLAIDAEKAYIAEVSGDGRPGRVPVVGNGKPKVEQTIAEVEPQRSLDDDILDIIRETMGQPLSQTE